MSTTTTTPVFSPPPQPAFSPEHQRFLEAWRKANSAVTPLALQESDPAKVDAAITAFIMEKDFPGKLKALEAAYGPLVDAWAATRGVNPEPPEPDEPAALLQMPESGPSTIEVEKAEFEEGKSSSGPGQSY